MALGARPALGRPGGRPEAFVWLASQSPRRRELLAQIGVACELLVADDAEDSEALEAERRGETPLAYVERVTRAKLVAARARLRRRGGEPAPILCADTTVAVGARILGKPADAADAARMLTLLSGRGHRVLTHVAVAARGGRVHAATVVSKVRFAPLTPRQIAAYVASGEPFGKAGAYAIQGRAGAFVEGIAGSYTAIMGLPLYETSLLLKRAGMAVAA